MKNIVLVSIFLVFSSCAGMKVSKEPPPAKKQKSGVTFGGPIVSGGFQVHKVGYWCDVKGVILTFGAFGKTEAQATENAQAQCHKINADHPCPVVACKPEDQKK